MATAGAATDDDRAGDHARGAAVGDVAPDQHHAPPHAIADAIAGASVDDHRAAPHAGRVARDGRAQEVAGVAAKMHETFRHAARGKRACIAVNLEHASRHRSARVRARVPMDRHPAEPHAGTEAIQAVAAVADRDVRGVFSGHVEDLANPHAPVSRAQFDARHVAGARMRERARRDGRHVDPLARHALQRERQRFACAFGRPCIAHSAISRSGKWNLPSLPP
jgi:hypothetical protein